MEIKLRSVKSSEHINEKGNGPYSGFGYLSLSIDPEVYYDLVKDSTGKFTLQPKHNSLARKPSPFCLMRSTSSEGKS